MGASVASNTCRRAGNRSAMRWLSLHCAAALRYKIQSVPMQLRLVGYFAKATEVPTGWPASDRVSEICSVSNCITSAPQGWINHWLHNEMGFFNKPSDARAVLTQPNSQVSLFAYR